MKFVVGILAIALIMTIAFGVAIPQDNPEEVEPEEVEAHEVEPEEVEPPEYDPEACQNCIMNNIGRCTVIFGLQAHCCPPAVETCCQENPDDIDDCYDREFEECCLTK